MTQPKAAVDWIQELAAGRRGFHQVPPDLDADEAAELRRRALEEQTGVSLEHIGHYSFDAERASTRNCENLIGVAQIPMGIVGPVRVRGELLDDEVSVPMATTEGALLASVNRGCAAIRRAGGARVHVEDVGMTRAPVFRTSGIEETNRFLAWVRSHHDDIRRVAEGTSRFLKLLEVRPQSLGTTVFLRFRFETGDAMGMNMATIACDRIVRDLIYPETGVRCVALSGNYCVDKKPSAINFQEGRGKRIYAEVLLEGEPLERTLKSNAEALVEVQYRKNLMGSIAAGSMGYNGQAANVLAGIFAATGQDLAHVVEGSMAVTGIEPKGEGVLFSVFLPDAPVAAVGGGTGLATQAEALRIMGIEPDEKQPGQAAMRLAEIVGAVVLAGEVSLMSALTSQDLAGAHERLGRGAPAGGGGGERRSGESGS